MTANDIIEALGGRKVLAEVLGVSRHAPYNWRTDGIPARHWPDIVARAAKLGIKGVSFDVLRATGARGAMRESRVIPPESNPVRKPSASDALRAVRKIETQAASR